MHIGLASAGVDCDECAGMHRGLLHAPRASLFCLQHLYAYDWFVALMVSYGRICSVLITCHLCYVGVFCAEHPLLNPLQSPLGMPFRRKTCRLLPTPLEPLTEAGRSGARPRCCTFEGAPLPCAQACARVVSMRAPVGRVAGQLSRPCVSTVRQAP